MKKQWVLIANGSLARIFSRTGVCDPLVALETIDFPEGRLKASAIERDRQGHESSDHSSAAAHFEPQTSTRQKVLNQFARELAARLEDGLVNGEYDAFWLTASGPLLGELRAALHPAVTARLKWAHDADFTGLDIDTIETRIHELAGPGVPP